MARKKKIPLANPYSNNEGPITIMRFISVGMFLLSIIMLLLLAYVLVQTFLIGNMFGLGVYSFIFLLILVAAYFTKQTMDRYKVPKRSPSIVDHFKVNELSIIQGEAFLAELDKQERGEPSNLDSIIKQGKDLLVEAEKMEKGKAYNLDSIGIGVTEVNKKVSKVKQPKKTDFGFPKL